MNGFLTELRRRKVLHTAAAYAVVGGGVIGTSSDVGDALNLPEAAVSFIVLATLIGFPVALVLAWFFEVRPEEPSDTAGSLGPEEVDSGRRRWGLVAAGGVAVLALTAGALSFSPFGLRAGVLDEGARVVVADFSSSAEELPAAAITALFETDLFNSTHVRPVSRGAIEVALRRMELEAGTPITPGVAREVAVRDGYEAVLEGEVSRAGTSFLMSASLVEASSGDVLVADNETAESVDDLHAAVTRLSARIREMAGEAVEHAADAVPLMQRTTASLEALALVSSRYRSPRLGDYVADLRHALELDPDFAKAKVDLAINLFLHFESSFQPEAQHLIEEAYEDRRRLTPGEQAEAEWAYLTFVAHEPLQAERVLAAFVEEYPEQALDYLWLLGLGALGREDYEASVRWHRQLQHLQGGRLFQAGININYFLGLTVIAPDDELRRLVVEDGRRVPMARAAYAREWWDDLERWSESEDWQAQMNPVEPYLSPMLLQLARGRIAAFQVATERYLEVMRARDGLAVAVDYRPFVDLLFEHDTAAALRSYPEPLHARHELERIEFLARAGRSAEARTALSEFDATEDDTVLMDRAWQRDGVHARVLLAEGLAEDAIRAVRRMEITKDTYFGRRPCRGCYKLTLAEAFETLQRPDSAAAAYEAFLYETRWAGDAGERFGRIPWLVPVHERLGQLYEQLDRPDDAVRHYRKMVEDWGEADAFLQPRVTAAREALARLESAR